MNFDGELADLFARFVPGDDDVAQRSRSIARAIHTENRSLAAIVEQLASCDYRCEAGPLVNNSAFLELRRLAEEQIEGAEERAKWAREYDADRRARRSARLEEK